MLFSEIINFIFAFNKLYSGVTIMRKWFKAFKIIMTIGAWSENALKDGKITTKEAINLVNMLAVELNLPLVVTPTEINEGVDKIKGHHNHRVEKGDFDDDGED